MIVSCPSCGRSNPPWASYCAKCGVKLDEAPPVDADRNAVASESSGRPHHEETPADTPTPEDRESAAAPVARAETGSPWPELPPDALAPYLQPAPVPAHRDPLAGLEPLPVQEPSLGVDREIASREALAPPPAHPSEPVLPPPSPVEASLGKPAFAEPPLPEPPITELPLPDESAGDSRHPTEPLLRVDLEDTIERVPEFGPARGTETPFGSERGAAERFGSARELSAARRFDADIGAATISPQRVEPTLDADAVTVTGDPNFTAGDDDPVYGALPPLPGERAAGERAIAPAIQVWNGAGGRTAWRRTGLAVVAIALVLAGGIAAIALIRLTAADVPASELSIAEFVDRAAARLREFGLLPGQN